MAAKKSMASLKDYHSKRQFEVTPEPRGAVSPASSGRARFVVQKHDATRLHYDFRLEIDGVLKSWAVPKGPSLNPADKRLAVQTEDHPLEYGSFHGTIPAGNYGAGEVRIWDEGTYEMEGHASASEQLRRGELKFILHGQKLHGSVVLVKLRRSESGREWLLIKHRDSAAVGSSRNAAPRVIVPEKANAEEADPPPAKKHTKRKMPAGARKAPMPQNIRVALAS